MKLKEIPLSIFHNVRLLLIPTDKLKSNSQNEIPVVVSLTSIPSRLHIVHLVVRSILSQEVHPKKVLLWLNNDLKNTIPKKLEKLESDIFEIRYSELNCSHRKLIHTLESHSNNTIITCDDDLMYDKTWLKSLYDEHLKNPDLIIANQIRYISYSEDGVLLPYKKWKNSSELQTDAKAVLPIGAGGVLYPPNSLSPETTNKDLFLKLTPKADDLWFKAMAVLKGTLSILSKTTVPTPTPIIGSQKQSLKKTNIGLDKNREQWLKVSEYFNISLKS